MRSSYPKEPEIDGGRGHGVRTLQRQSSEAEALGAW